MNIRKKATYYLITLVIWLALFWGAGELLIRLLYPSIRNYNLEMWRYAKDMKQPLPHTNLPFHHYPNREGTYYGVDIKTNAFGFRSDPINLEKDTSKKRLLFIGDSFTLGWGVPFDSTFSQRLGAKVGKDRMEVINLGIGNYNAVMQTALFKEKGLPLTPDVVVLMYFVNDTEPIPRRSALEGSILSRSYFLAFLFDRYHKIKVITNKNYNWMTYYKSLYKQDNPSLSANQAAVEELINICKEQEIKLLIGNIPELHQLEPYSFPEATDFISSIARRHQVPFLDFLSFLASEEPADLWVSKEDQHANAYANKLMADAIWKKLIELNYIEQ